MRVCPMQKWIAAGAVTAAVLLATIPARAQYAGHGPTSQQFDYHFETIPIVYKGKVIRANGTVFPRAAHALWRLRGGLAEIM